MGPQVNALTIPPFEGGNMCNRPYSTNVLTYLPASLVARAAKWPLLGAEVELPYIDMALASRRLNGAAIVKDDATIPDGGGEVVYHPMTYKQLRSRFETLAYDTGVQPDDFTANCGTHIHLSPAWDIDAGDLKRAFNSLPEDILNALAGRTETEYCRRRGSTDSHTSAVSVSHRYGTIEVRHAQGSASGYRLVAWLDTVYGLAKHLRKGTRPLEAARALLAHPTSDMARVIAEGPPYITSEPEDERRYCEGCDNHRDDEQFTCGYCDNCERCCECTICTSCDSGGDNFEVCDTCETCPNCCLCVHCQECGDVADTVGDCSHGDEHAELCSSCCTLFTCAQCDEPRDYAGARSHETNWISLCHECALPVIAAYHTQRTADFAIRDAEDRDFVGPRRVKLSELTVAQLTARGLQYRNAYRETGEEGGWEWVYAIHIPAEEGGYYRQ